MINSRLQAVLALTDRVQAAIDAGDWQLAHDVETERRAELEALVAEQAKSRELSRELTGLAHRNHRMVGVLQHRRRAILRDAETVRTGHAAVAAYDAAAAET
jgi:hypothetical protein